MEIGELGDCVPIVTNRDLGDLVGGIGIWGREIFEVVEE